MGAFLWKYCFYGLWWICVLANGFFLYQLCRPFVKLRKGRLWQALLLLTLAGSSGMVIWVGDPNLLYTLPVYILLFLLSTKGDWTGRLAVCIIFFCLEMSVCALLDTYVVVPDSYRLYDLLVRLLRTAIFGILWLVLRRRFPEEQVHLSRRLWQVVLGLAAMPLCALVAVVLLTFQKYESAAVNTLAMNQGLVVLPFVLLTSIVLLSAVLILADHERLERASQLAGLREVYYQGLQQQERQVRTLRHDLRNHLTVILGLLKKRDTQGAIGYLEQMANSPALQGSKRFCDNEAANVVLSAKAEVMEQEGITADFAVSLPKELSVTDTHLAALLGNALDNAIESCAQEGDPQKRIVFLNIGAKDGLLRMRVENYCSRPVRFEEGLPVTTKADRQNHGIGVRSIRYIAQKYGGNAVFSAEDGFFRLSVLIPLAS